MYSRSFLLLLPLILALPSPLRAREARAFEVDTHKDIAYRTGEGADPVRHQLDLYLPKDARDFPVVFFIHGGAWSMGNKNEYGLYEKLGKALAAQGIGMVSINYRLTPKVTHPGHIEDVAEAFAWVHANIGEYGGDRTRLFVSGHSAGGHLCALLTTDERYLKKHGLNARAIRGCVPVSGVFFLPTDFMKNVFGNDADQRKQASPAMHTREGLPPFLILYADADLKPCGKGNCENFCDLLRKKGVDASAREFKDCNHLLILLQLCNPEQAVFSALRDFIRKHSAN